MCNRGESPLGSCPTSHRLAYIFPLAATLAYGTVLFSQPPRAATRLLGSATPTAPVALGRAPLTCGISAALLSPLSLFSSGRFQLCRKPAVCQGSVGPLHLTPDASQEPRAHRGVGANLRQRLKKMFSQHAHTCTHVNSSNAAANKVFALNVDAFRVDV